MFAWKRKAMSYIIRSSSVSTLDFGLSRIETMTIARARRIQTPIEYCMSFKKCQTIPIMTLIYSISSMDEYVEFRHAISSSISVRLKCAKYLGVKSCYRIATERIYIPLQYSIRTFQRLPRTLLI